MPTYESIRDAAIQRWQELIDGPDAWIRVGAAMCGHSAGAYDVIDALRSELARRGIAARVDEVGCLGICYAEPLVDVKRPGEESRLFFGGVSPEDAPAIVESYLANGDASHEKVIGYLGDAAIGDAPNLAELPGIGGSAQDSAPQRGAYRAGRYISVHRQRRLRGASTRRSRR